MKKKTRKVSHARKSKKIVVKQKKKLVSKKPTVIKESVLVDHVLPKKKRKPKTPSNKMYFTPDTQKSIIKYNLESDVAIRNDIYNNEIKYPFEKLVENIFNTFKFSYFETGPQDVQKETVSHLVANIQKYDPTKGKAFAYFSIIAKHYLIALNNGTWKRRNQHVEIGEEYDEHTVQLQSEDKHYKSEEMKDFMKLMIEFWENNVGKIFNKQRDLEIANAVIELFRSSDRIDAFNKKALYLYIREISSCKTQQITKVINRMKQYQSNISKSYVVNGSINTGNYIKA